MHVKYWWLYIMVVGVIVFYQHEFDASCSLVHFIRRAVITLWITVMAVALISFCISLTMSIVKLFR